MELQVRKLRNDAVEPRYATQSAAGLDLTATMDSPVTIGVGAWERIPTGIAIMLPKDCEGQVRPRSGLAARHGVTVLNAPGTIDADYRGEVQILLINHGTTDYVVRPGERIAQLVVAPVAHVQTQVVTTLPASERGDGGFGSTG